MKWLVKQAWRIILFYQRRVGLTTQKPPSALMLRPSSMPGEVLTGNPVIGKKTSGREDPGGNRSVCPRSRD